MVFPEVVNFFHSNWYRAVFWLCTLNRADNKGVFLLLLSDACTEPMHFLLLTSPHATSEEGVGAQGV